jgi:hypothetical protein
LPALSSPTLSSQVNFNYYFSLGLTHDEFWGNWYVPFKTVPTRDIRNSVHEKGTEFREIPRNFKELYVTEFGGIPPEF